MRRMTKQWLGWGGGILGLGLIVWLFIAAGGGSASTVPAPDATDHASGPLTAPAVLIEYSDFQCPACGQYEPIVEQLQKQFGSKLTLVYREYPLRQLHQYAQTAAQAAEAANLQNKFWDFHDLLFSRQSSWSQSLDVRPVLIGYAEELKLDVAKFTTDLDSQAVKDRIERDVTTGTAARIPGTPTFFLNGKQIVSPGSYDAFAQLITDVINK